MRNYVLFTVLLIAVSDAATAESEIPFDTPSDMIRYAERLAGEGKIAESRTVFDTIVGAFTKADEWQNVHDACRSLVSSIPASEIRELEPSFHNCPRQLLVDWVGDLAPVEWRPADVPTPIDKTAAAYPAEALELGLEGYVDLEFNISTQGLVINIRVAASSNTLFENAAIESLSGWRYEPAMENGKLIQQNSVRTRISFAIEE